MKVDKETIAISVIVGGALIYFFSTEARTPAQIAEDARFDDMQGALRTLAGLETRYDALLHPLEQITSGSQLPEWLGKELGTIASLCSRLEASVQQLSAGEEFYTRTAELIRSCTSRIQEFHYDQQNRDE